MFTLRPTTLQEAVAFADIIAKSDLVPEGYKGKPANCIIAVQMGAEIGLPPMQAIQGIAVINGRPSVWGDALRALILSAPDLDDVIETDDGAAATCVIKRKGRSPVTATFSIKDAEAAGLAGKAGPWKNYPKRMRQHRAFAFAARDSYADRLKGLQVAEEQLDVDAERTTVSISEPRRVGELAAPAIDVKAEPQPAAATTNSTPATRSGAPDPAPSPAPPASKPPVTAAAAPPKASQPTAAAAPASPAAPATGSSTTAANAADQTERRCKIVDTKYIPATTKTPEFYEITTSRGVFLTQDEQLHKSASSCMGTDHEFAIAWRPAKRQNGDVIKRLLDLTIDDDPADPTGLGAPVGDGTDAELAKGDLFQS
jgi:hypothetical protein